MKRVLLLAAVLVAAPTLAAPRVVTLRDAVALAIKVDPLMDSVQVDRDRGKLGVLRAQLDRITLKVDGALQEIWGKGNIAGPTIPGYCQTGTAALPIGETACVAAGGTFIQSAQSPSVAQGLLNLSANLAVPLFAGFRIDATVKRAQRTEEAAIVQIRRQRRDTALAAARAFWSVRRLEMQAEVQRASLERMADAERVAGGRFKAGLAPPIDKNRATVRRLQQAASLADYEGQIAEAIAQLGVSLGLKGELKLDGRFTFPEGPPPDPAALLDAAHDGRPELEVARLNIEAQRQTVRIAKSGYYPQLGVFGLLQYGNNLLSIGSGVRDASQVANPFSGTSLSVQLGASLNMNFFDTLRTYTSTRDAQYVQASLMAERRRVERAIDADVLATRARVEKLVRRRAPLRDALELARDNAKILEGRYRNGDALIIELLDSQLELAQSEAAVVDLEAQLELAWVELRASLGEEPGRP